MKIANRAAREYVTRLQEFKGSNIFAERTFRKESDQFKNTIRETAGYALEVYAVYSYGHHFPIYARINGQWYRNKDKYSVSTSRHQSQCNPYYSNMIEVDTETLRSLIGCN
jgi:hypothetical protein